MCQTLFSLLVIKRVHKKDKISVLMELTIYWKETFIYGLFRMPGGEKYYNENIG